MYHFWRNKMLGYILGAMAADLLFTANKNAKAKEDKIKAEKARLRKRNLLIRTRNHQPRCTCNPCLELKGA
jgi:hypothetical protein